MAFPTYKLGCDRRYIPMVSMINSTSCQSTLSSTSPWHTADRIDFLFSGHLLMLLASSPFTDLLVLCSKTAPCPEAEMGLRQLRTTRSAKRPTTILTSCVLDKAYSSSRWWLKPAAAGGARPPLPPSENWALCTLLDLGCLRVMGPNNFSKLCLLPCNVRTRGPSSDGSLSPLTVCHPWPSLDLFDFDIWFLITPQSPESHRDQ